MLAGLCAGVLCFAQKLSDTEVQVIAYWDKGDVMVYDFTQSRTQTEDGVVVDEKKCTEKHIFEVIGATDDSYTVRFSFDDVISTTVMAMLYGGQLQAMSPRLKAQNFPGMELIRPLYLVHESDIIAWKNAHGLSFIQCACRFTENAANDHSGSKRLEVRELIRKLKETNPHVEDNIFASIHNLQLDSMVGWKYQGEEHSFLDQF